jgi:hypothetical protein
MTLIKLFLAGNTWGGGGVMYVLFLAGNTSALARFFPDQERKIPGNPQILEVFPARKSSISDAPAGGLQRDVIYFG